LYNYVVKNTVERSVV